MTPGYHVAKFGNRWGIVFRLNESTSFDQKVRYSTKRKAETFAAMLNRAEIVSYVAPAERVK